MEDEEKIKARFKEMVTYCMDTKDGEVIDNYTETFLTIYKEGVAEYKKDVDELVESIAFQDPAVQAYYDELKIKLKILSMDIELY